MAAAATSAAIAAAPFVLKGLGSLFGKKKKSSSGTEYTTESLKSNTTTSNMSAEDQALLRALSGTAAGNAQGFGREQALADSSGLINSAMRSLREQAIPDILKTGITNGVYGSTIESLLANDAAARAAEAVGRQQSDIVANYGQIQNQGLSTAGQLLEALKGATVVTDVDSTGVTDKKLTGSATGGGSGILGAATALAGGVSAYQNTKAGDGRVMGSTY